VKKLVALLALAVVALTATALASASPRSEVMLGAKLDAMQDHATSHGTGTFTATLTGSKLSWHLSFKGLTGKATAAHIHLGAKGKSGNVLIPLCTPCTRASMGTVKLNAMQLRDVTKGATYVNVHTAKNPNGEIRGQLAAH
jgi:CHRD domain